MGVLSPKLDFDVISSDVVTEPPNLQEINYEKLPPKQLLYRNRTLINQVVREITRDFKPTILQAKIVVIQHNKSHVTSISHVVWYTSEFNIVITTWVEK